MTSQNNSQHSVSPLVAVMQGLMEHLSRLTAIRPGSVLMSGISEAGQNFNDAMLRGLSSPGTSSQLNKALRT
jgi:hypothetical protein